MVPREHIFTIFFAKRSHFFCRFSISFLNTAPVNFLLEWASNNSRVCADGRGESSLYSLSFFFTTISSRWGVIWMRRDERQKSGKKNTIDSIKKYNFFFLSIYLFAPYGEKIPGGISSPRAWPFFFIVFLGKKKERHSGGSPPIYIINCFI